MSLRGRLTVAGALVLTELLGFLMLRLLRSILSYELDDLYVALVIVFLVGAPAAGMMLARRLVPEQRSNGPAYLVFGVNLFIAVFDEAGEDVSFDVVMTVAIVIAVWLGIFVAAFLGTYLGPQAEYVSPQQPR